MGGGTFSRVAYTSYADTTKHLSREERFVARTIKKPLDPKNVKYRESCDSEEHPNSRPFILALDVSGSMGMIAEYIAATALGDVVDKILSKVVDPHIMFMGIGDVHCDSAPLQVSQFESDNRIQQQLTDMWLEGGGGNNDSESYDFAWYFAAHHTKCDAWEKRNQKGYLFTFGDEMPPEGISDKALSYFMGTTAVTMQKAGFQAVDLLNAAKEKWEVFHLIVEEGSFSRSRPERTVKAWQSFMGNRAVPLKKYKHLPDVIMAIIRVNEGESVDDVVESFKQEASYRTVKHAFNYNPQE